MFRNLIENLSKNQKIGIAVILQIIIILILAASLKSTLAPKIHVDVANKNETAIPNDTWNGIKNELWYLIQKNVMNADKSNINDAVIREGTYTEAHDNDITTATFLLDIDSLRQTYFVTASWSDKVELYDAITINCPQQSEMKYPETVCYGMYNNTYSLDLYLPYVIYPDGFENDEADEPMAPNYMISGDEDDKTIEIMVSTCDAEKYKKEAMDYLKTTPINLDDYRINYEINSVNVRC